MADETPIEEVLENAVPSGMEVDPFTAVLLVATFAELLFLIWWA